MTLSNLRRHVLDSRRNIFLSDSNLLHPIHRKKKQLKKTGKYIQDSILESVILFYDNDRRICTKQYLYYIVPLPKKTSNFRRQLNINYALKSMF